MTYPVFIFKVKNGAVQGAQHREIWEREEWHTPLLTMAITLHWALLMRQALCWAFYPWICFVVTSLQARNDRICQIQMKKPTCLWLAGQDLNPGLFLKLMPSTTKF